MLSEERKHEILQTITPTVVSEELVQDGTGLNNRPLVLKYEAPDFIITESYTYRYATNHAGWREATTTYEWEVNNGE